MSLTTTSIHRPVATTMMFLIVIVMGLIGFRFLPVDLLPPIEMTELNVEVRYPNVGPEEMELLVTEPLENSLSVVSNLERISSRSSEGSAQVSLRFAHGTDLAEASNDVREVLDRIRNSLPDDADPPRINKFNPDQLPVVMVGVRSDRDLTQLTTILEREIRQRFEQIPGIGSIDVWGGMNRQIKIDIMRDRLLATGLTMDDIVQAIRTESSTSPGGNVQRGVSQLYIRSLGEYNNLDEIRDTVIRTVNGVPLRVGDVATVSDSRADLDRYIEVDGVPMARLALRKQTGANTVAVAEAARSVVEQLNRERTDMEFLLMNDQSTYIQQSMDNVRNSAVWGGILAVIIMLAFFRNGSVTMIIAVSIPISIIATFALLYLGGLSLNQMSFGGLAMGVGMIVDNAIVVVENIVRHRTGGKGLIESAITGARQVTGAVIASTATTVVVFLPVVFMQTITGSMFKQLATVVVFSLVCSLIVAITLIPMLASRFLTIKPTPPQAASSKPGMMQRATQRYAAVLEWALDHRLMIIGATLLMMGAAIYGARGISYELAPQTQAEGVNVNIRMAEGTNITILHNYLGELDRMLRDSDLPWEYIRHYAKEVRNGQGQIELIMRTDMTGLNVTALADRLRNRLVGAIPGADIRVTAQSGLWILNRIFGGNSDDAVQVELRGHNLNVAQNIASEIQLRLMELPGIVGVNISQLEGRPEQSVRFDRRRMAEMGISIQQVASAIQTSLSGTRAAVFREGGDEFDITVRLRPEDRLNAQDIENISVRSPSGQVIPISALIETSYDRGPTQIQHIDGQRVTFITASLESGVALGDAMVMIQNSLRDYQLPEDFSLVMGGQYEEQLKAERDFTMAIVMAVILIYMVMAAQFERFLDPLIVMFSIPLALIGVVPTLIITNTTINMQSLMGLMMLVGIVVNNAILLVDYINLMRREEGLGLRASVVQAGSLRLQPILMTTSTTVLGLLPLALGIGAGAELQAALARVVVGGLLASTLITLVFIPVLYVTAQNGKVRVVALLTAAKAKVMSSFRQRTA
jgi:HAE1 family hydrophobic/amphiphilic exporter-1